MESPIYLNALAWCEKNDNIRAAVLTSSRARNDGSADALSDYDLELYVDDLAPFSRDDLWLESFGDVLVRWPLTPRSTSTEKWITRLVQYEEGTRIDFQIKGGPLAYHDNFDAGYLVILDKDNQAAGLAPPQGDNLLIKKPTAREYAEGVNAFFWDILYVPKALKRDELFWARYMMDNVVRYHMLLPMIEWHIGLAGDWKVGTNKGGRWIKPYLSGEIWQMCEKTFAGAGAEDNQQALHTMITLFGRLAREVGDGLGYAYPGEQERRVLEYIRSIEGLDLRA